MNPIVIKLHCVLGGQGKASDTGKKKKTGVIGPDAKGHTRILNSFIILNDGKGCVTNSIGVKPKLKTHKKFRI